MTISRIFASGTLEDPIILSNYENDPEVSQELTHKEVATVMNQPTTIPETLLVLLVVQRALFLKQNRPVL